MAAAAVSLMSPLSHNMQGQRASDERSHELPRPYKCPLCDKAFHRLEHQTRHIRTHTGEKPHACQFPGCSKRFSRSDELTRHSRIHNNPNSRRANRHNAAAAAAAAAASAAATASTTVPEPYHNLAHVPRVVSRSAPNSKLASPNVSPPYSFAQPTTTYSHQHEGGSGSADSSPNGLRRHLDINLLATAAKQVERDSRPIPHSHPRSRRPLSHHQYLQQPNHHHQYQQPPPPPPPSFSSSGSPNKLPGLSQYAYSAQPMTRSLSNEDDDHYSSHRLTKKSRPASPLSTAPPSPSFSHDSYSTTPDHTPLATPVHSPRLRPHATFAVASGGPAANIAADLQLPHLRHLSIAQAPTLMAMEPNADGSSHSAYMPGPSSGVRISDIVERPNAAQRRLPIPNVPKVTVHDLLNTDPVVVSSSGHSPPSSSVSGGDLAERY